MAEHLVVTGPLDGRIPISHPKHPEGWVDVTPPVLTCDDDDHAAAVLEAIEHEHAARGTHPDLDAYRQRYQPTEGGA